MELNPQAFNFETLTVSSTAIGCTAATISDANRAVFGPLETGEVRYRYDGDADPTSSVGHLLSIGQSLVLEGNRNITQFRAIRTSVDASLPVTYEH